MAQDNNITITASDNSVTITGRAPESEDDIDAALQGFRAALTTHITDMVRAYRAARIPALTDAESDAANCDDVSARVPAPDSDNPVPGDRVCITHPFIVRSQDRGGSSGNVIRIVEEHGGPLRRGWLHPWPTFTWYNVQFPDGADWFTRAEFEKV